ncbi:MAG: ABC transporter substrate-binding protein [Agrococcus casei]|uniref:ABC transporter substrate-binding protein n=1 Tax=Agrococcus casei TaxID=343512 RepID=UPI003F8F6EF4
MKKKTAVAASMVAVLALSSCANPEIEGGSDEGNSTTIVEAVEVNDEIAALLPQSYHDSGITVSINPDVEPIKFVDSEGNIVGLNPDLLRAAGNVLGVDIKFEQGTFDGMVPGLEAKRFDVIASVADFVERQENIDFIDYMYNGTAIIASADFEKDEIALEDLCGLSVGYARGTSQQGSLEQVVQLCEDSGAPALQINGYGDGGAGVLSVQSGEAEAYWGDLPQMAYNAAQSPEQFKVIYKEQRSILGIGVHKDDTELRDALHSALLSLVEDGTYDMILENWGQQDAAYPSMDINSDISLED